MDNIKKKEIFKQVGNRIRILRQNKGMSQEELAVVCGLHRSHMGQIERGESNTTLGTLWRIGLGLEVSVIELLKGIK